MMTAILNSASILNSGHIGFSHFAQKTSLVHSDSIWWWQPSWNLPCCIQTLPSWIQTPCHLLSDSLKNNSSSAWTLTQTNSIWLTWWWQPFLNSASILNSAILDSAIFVFLSNSLTLAKIGSHSIWHKKTFTHWILTQLDDGSHLELMLGWIQTQCVIFSEIHSKTLSLSSLTLTQTNSLWLKLIHSHTTWWW